MELDISPNEGVGPIRFGMRIEEVRTAVGGAVDMFKKTPSSAMPTDSFSSSGLHVYYRLPGNCEAVEMAAPANPKLFGRELIGAPFAEIKAWLLTLDENLTLDDDGLNSSMLGVGIYAPAVQKRPDATVEGVMVFETGYYS